MDNSQDQTLSLTPPAPEPQTLDIDTNQPPTLPPSQEVVNRRAYKATAGLGELLNRNYQVMQADIAGGKEGDLRADAATKLDLINNLNRQQKIKDLTLDNGGPLSFDQVNAIIDPNAPVNQPVKPSSVIEGAYGKAVVDTLDEAHKNLGSSIIGTAQDQVPLSFNEARRRGSTFIASRERALTEAENIQDTISKQSWLGWGWDTAKTFFQPYDEAKLRGLVDGMYLQGGALGSNLHEQADALMGKPLDQQNAFWDGPVWQKVKTDNPQLAQQFLTAFLGQSSSDRILSDLNTAMVIPDLKGLGALGPAVARRVGLINQSRNAVRSVVEASQLPNATKASMLDAAGDAEGAATHQAMSNVVSDLNGHADLNQRALDALPSALRSDQAKIREASPGREIVNRLEEDTEDLVTKLTGNVLDSSKVARIPEIIQDDDKVLQIIKKQRDNYRGPSNSLGDSTGPALDERSNTYWIEHQLRNSDGTYFDTPEQARGWGKANGFPTETPKSYKDFVDTKVTQLQEELKTPPAMDADVNELNRYTDMENQLEALSREQKNLNESGLDGYRVKQQGAGFYISYMQPLNETDALVRSMIGTTAEGQLQDTWLNGVSRWLRTPMETLSQLENQQRIIATHGPSNLQKLFSEASEPIKKLPGKYYDDWSRAIDFARTAVDPETKRTGYFFKDINDMDDWYQRYSNEKRLPSDPEIRAYFAFKRNIEAERQLRITRAYSLKTRIGVEQHSFYALDQDGNRVASPYVEGVRRTKDEPFGGEDTVLVMGNKIGDEKLMKANDPRLKKVRADIKKGQRDSVELYNPDDYPLKDFNNIGDARVRFVITNQMDTKPLSYENQINRTGGGHFVYDYKQYIKTPDMKFDPVSKQWNYNGDITAFPVTNGKLGADYAEHMNEVSRLLEEGKEGEAQAYHAANELPMKWEDHKAAYTEGRFPKGSRFYVVHRNQRIVDVDKTLENKFNSLDPENPQAFRDRTRQGSLARQSTVEFSGERDAEKVQALDDKGTMGNPIFSIEPAKMVDPIVTYNRALSRIINSSYIDDYKIHAVERWISQAKNLLDVSDGDLNHSPFYYFANANDNWMKDADPVRKAALQAAKFNIDQFVGVPSKVDNYINSVAQKLADSIYGRAGPTAAGKVAQVSELPYIKDPLSFMRGVTFHLKMGLGSPAQLLMQMTTASNVMAVAGGTHIPASLTAVMLHQWSRLNKAPEIMAKLDEVASKMNLPGFSRFKPGEWQEANKFITDYLGFDNIGGEHAFRDTPWSAKIVKSLGQDILDWGEAPFREGAQFTRLAAGYAAYLEFRQGPMSGKGIIGALTGGPDTIFRRGSVTGALSREDKASIAARAADLDHNMSRAANSPVHTGVMSPFGQFTAYSLRLMELMTGKRLTWQEKSRLFGVSSVLYGVPVGGLGLYGYPIGDAVREKAKDMGYIVGDNTPLTIAMDGLPSQIMKIVTGDNYNISRFGAKGFDPAGELMNSDSTVWKIFGGAAFSTLGNMWAETNGIRNFAISSIRGDQEQYPLTQDDVVSALGVKEWTFGNSLLRLRAALNTGKWMSKNGTPLSEVTPLQAWIQTATGVVNQNTADVTISSKALKAEKELNTQTEKAFEAAVLKARQAAIDNDPEQSRQYLMQAKAIMGPIGDYPQEKRAQLWSRALKTKDTLDQQLLWDFLMRDTPASKSIQRQHTYERINQIQQEQKAQ